VPKTVSLAWVYSVVRSPASLPEVRRISRGATEKRAAWSAGTPRVCSQALLHLLQPHRIMLVVEAINLIPFVTYTFTFFNSWFETKAGRFSLL